MDQLRKTTSLNKDRYCFLDTETTGFSWRDGDRVIEFGVVEMVGRKLTGRRLHRYVCVDQPISTGAYEVHGITDVFLSDKPDFAAVIDEVIKFCAGAHVVIHNASFDVGFLDNEFELAGRLPFSSFPSSITDCLKVAREKHPGGRNSLDALASRYGVDHVERGAHGALKDANLLAEVWMAMSQGQEAMSFEGDAPEVGSAGQMEVLDIPHHQLRRTKSFESSEESGVAHEACLAQIFKETKNRIWR